MAIRKHPEGRAACPALRWILASAFLLVWACAVGVAALHYASQAYGSALFSSYLASPALLALNLLPGLVIALFFFALTNRVWPGVLASGVLVILGAVVDCFKLQARAEPLLASDLKYVTEAANISSRYELTVSRGMILCACGVLAATVFACLFLKARMRTARGRSTFRLVILLCAPARFFCVYRSERIYEETENLDVVFPDGRTLSEWNGTDQFVSRGFWYPFLYNTENLGPKKPAGYSPAAAEALLAAYPSADIPEGKKVSVLSIMLEAYADFSGYEQLRFTNDPYRFFHALQAESISGSIDTNIFAGGTIDTERCYLTGSLDLYEYAVPVDSFARWFSAQGYVTQFCHPGLNWFYNRENVAEYLGFDFSAFGGTYFELVDADTPILDEVFFPQLVELLHNAAAGGAPCFNMSVTYQNHGPYAADQLYDPDREFIARNGLSDASYCTLNNYFWGLDRTDAALETLVETLRGDPEPVVLVLFGDHKPLLGDFSSVYAEAGIDLSFVTDESFYNYCQTPYVIWANDAAKAVLGTDFSGDGGDFSPCYLMMKVFDACGYTGDAFMNFLRAAYAELDLVSPRLSHYRSGGNLTIHTFMLPEAARQKLRELEILSWYRAHQIVR
jgi:hypothetical protein